MAYIDADKLKKNIRVNLMPNVDIDGTVTVENAERYFLNLIDKTSTADVVEVVRCKDCKRCYEKRTKRNKQLMRFCMRMDGNEYQVNANDFCSYGTPKERGEDK